MTLGSSVSLGTLQKPGVRRKSNRCFDPFCKSHPLPHRHPPGHKPSGLCWPLLASLILPPAVPSVAWGHCRIPELGPGARGQGPGPGIITGMEPRMEFGKREMGLFTLREVTVHVPNVGPRKSGKIAPHGMASGWSSQKAVSSVANTQGLSLT